MTDYEMTEKFLVSLGIDYKKDQYSEPLGIDYKNNKVTVVLRLEQGTKKVKGYTRFICEFYFDVGGKFIEIGIWE